jgi:hypothetical protein
MSVSVFLISNELAQTWAQRWVYALHVRWPAVSLTTLTDAFSSALMDDGRGLIQRPADALADTLPLELPAIKRWAKAQVAFLKDQGVSMPLAHVHGAWAAALGASGWGGVPGQINVLNAARAEARVRLGPSARQAREQELTQSAIDWALSIIEDMHEFTQGDASALTDMAIDTAEKMLCKEDEDASWFDADAIEQAIQREFDALNAEEDDDVGEDEDAEDAEETFEPPSMGVLTLRL